MFDSAAFSTDAFSEFSFTFSEQAAFVSEYRLYTVPAQDRGFTVTAQDRMFSVAFQSRSIDSGH